MDASDRPAELQMLIDALERAEGAEARQDAWNALVEYQRQRGVRAQPEQAPSDGRG